MPRPPRRPLRQGVALAALLLGGAGVQAPAAQIALSVPAVRGAVLDERGIGIPGVELLLGGRSYTTDTSGVFRITGLAVGRHPVLVRKIGYLGKRTELEIATRDVIQLIYLEAAPFNLPPMVVEGRRTGLYGEVWDSVFRPAVGAQVQLLGGQSVRGVTDTSGRFSFPDAAGKYLVRVTMRGHAERRFSVTVEPDRGREARIWLARPGPNDKPVGNREVWALNDLRQRLAVTPSRHILTRDDLARYGVLPVCEIPEIKRIVGTSSGFALVDGQIPRWDVCHWRAHELELVELGSDASRTPLSFGVERRATSRYNLGRRTGPQRYLIVWQRK